MARVTDGANKTATVQLFTFTVANAVTDSAAPETTLTPFPGNTTTANPVVLSGTATDDLSVETVRVGIRDRTTLTWLQADGTWKTAFAWRPATLANPKTPSTTWTYSFPDTGSGSYGAQVVAVDTAGKVDPTNVWYLFTA